MHASSCCGPAREPGTSAAGPASRASGTGEAVNEEEEAAVLKAEVRSRYADAARRAASGGRASCGNTGAAAPPAAPGAASRASAGCGCAAGADGPARDPITADLYERSETLELPAEALLASLGCGNPTALASLSPGEVVLDLGSGGGIDVLLSARRVAPGGKAYGLDMTEEMLALARENQRRAGVQNAEFLAGDIEEIPLPDDSVDVVISNCVINLAADKAQVLREAFRVLRPGGRFAVSDIVVRDGPAMPENIRRSTQLWIGCVAGALGEQEYRSLLVEAGFTDVDLEPTRIYGADDARAFLEGTGMAQEGFVEAVGDRFMSAFVRARKPV